MSNLSALKLRISGVKSTQKITRAMKMIAASKLIKVKKQLESSYDYAIKMEQVVNQLTNGVKTDQKISPLIDGTGSEKINLLILVTSDRGLCGSFNSSLVRELVKKIEKLTKEEKDFKIFCIGKKGYDIIKNNYANHIIHSEFGISRQKLTHFDVQKISNNLIDLFEQNIFDVAFIIYNHFKSAISSTITTKQIIPLERKGLVDVPNFYEFEPHENELLRELLPKNLVTQIYYILLNSLTSEHGTRMSAMENASNNAKEMLKKLTLVYNRTRQSNITKELIEIISGAESLK